jgi:serine/threonine-protein kinase HipA
MAGDEGVRLSLAGAQEKLAIHRSPQGISIPLGGAPSTHILKPAIERFGGLIHNEAFCMNLARLIGLSVAPVEVGNIEGIDYLLVERYDRRWEADGEPIGQRLKRIHQEDFCQALGIVPERKYQNEGGPSLKESFVLLRECSSSPVLDLNALLDAVIFNALIGNHDAHGKNFSMIYSGGKTRMAPLYDLLCTTLYTELSTKMAMKVGGEYDSTKADRCKLGAHGRGDWTQQAHG